jgi:hypothetical protein
MYMYMCSVVKEAEELFHDYGDLYVCVCVCMCVCIHTCVADIFSDEKYMHKLYISMYM